MRWLLCVCITGAAAPTRAADELATQLLALSDGARVKVAWAQDERGDHTDWSAKTDGFALWGYDTTTDTTAAIRSTWSSYDKPIIAHDGERVVYTNRVEHQIYVVDWDGNNHHVVTAGFGGALWYDVQTGIEWLYFQAPGDEDEPVERLNLDDPEQVELVWDQTPATSEYLMVSGDGARVVGCWPWPECGVIVPRYDGAGGGELYNSETGHYANGCLPTITPDDTYRVGVFEGTHRMWNVWDSPSGPQRQVQLHTAVPDMSASDCVYHPRHGTHPRFIALAAPMLDPDDPVEIHIGKTDAAFTEVTDWVPITNSDLHEMWPHVWVESGSVRIDVFRATPTSISSGASAELSWTTTNATGVTIGPEIGDVATSGTRTVSPLQTTTYTLTASGPGGPLTRTVSVNVVVPELDRILLDPPRGVVLAGGSLSLTARPVDSSGAAIVAALDWSTSGGGAVTADNGALEEHGAVFLSDGSTGSFEVTATAGAVSTTIPVTVHSPEAIHLRINAGDGSPSVSGWEDEDSYRNGGQPFDFPGPVDDNGQPQPAPADVYLTCIHGDHDYSIPVPDGPYRLRFHFFDHLDDNRAMVISAEGETLLEDFDIPTQAGGTHRALVREFDVDVLGSDGLQITDRMGSGGDVFESGLEVIALDEAAPGVTITDPGDRLTGHVMLSGTATDDVAVHSVEVTIDDGVAHTADGTAAWSFDLLTADLSDGEHTLTARAVDWVGNTTTAELDVTVSNRPSITILRPAGGEVWESGSLQTIEWETTNLEHVTIALSLDGGVTFETPKIVDTLQQGEPGWGQLSWTVPDTPTENAVVSIVGYFLEAPTLSARFAIVPPTRRPQLAMVGTGCNAGQDGATAAITALLVVGLAFRRSRVTRRHGFVS